MSTERLQLDAAKRVLGLLLVDDLPESAACALVEGCDSPSLRILAAVSRVEVDAAGRLFDKSLSELGIPIPSQRDAVMRVAREIAKEILSGSVSSYEGARRIWDISAIPGEDFPELHTFVYGASEWSDRPEDGDLFEAGIIAAAKDLVSH